MKRSILSALLALALILLAGCGGNSATATTLVTTPAPTPEASVEYHSDEFGFSIDIPAEYEDVIGMEIQHNPDPDVNVGAIVMPNEFVSDMGGEVNAELITFIYKPSRSPSGLGGKMNHILAISPRSAYLTYDFGSDDLHTALNVGGISRDCIFIVYGTVGGVDAGPESLEAYKEATRVIYDNALVIDAPEALPEIDAEKAAEFISANSERSETITRGEAALAMYGLFRDETKGAEYAPSLSDLDGEDCAAAVGWFESYGMLTGDSSGTFRPDAPMTRAEFSVFLHRVLFMPLEAPHEPGLECTDYSTYCSDHWADAYLTDSWQRGWLTVYGDGTYRPDAPVTYAEFCGALKGVFEDEKDE